MIRALSKARASFQEARGAWTSPRAWAATPSLWIVLAGFCFGCMSVLVKAGGRDFSAGELVFYRSAFGLLLAGAMVARRGASIRTPHLHLHLFRGCVGVVALILYFFTISLLPVSVAVTLTHTAPIFVVPIAAVVLRERATLWQAAAIALGFVGVVLLLRPMVSAGSIWPSMMGLLVGFATAIGYVNMRQLGQHNEPEWRVVFYFTLTCLIGAGLFAAATGFHRVDSRNVWILLGVGISGTAAEFARTRAYKRGRTLPVTTLTYSNVVFASMLGACLLGEILTMSTWIAFLVIATAGIVASHAARERQRIAR